MIIDNLDRKSRNEVSLLVKSFERHKINSQKAIANIRRIILKDTRNPDEICSNFKLIRQMLEHKKTGKKDVLFRDRITADDLNLKDIVFALIRHQIHEKKIDFASVEKSKIKKLPPDNFELHFVPERVRSSTVVHSRDEYKDNCPICLERMEESDKRVWFWRDYYIFGNHSPIVDNHLMITYKKHGSQTMTREFIEDIIDLNAVFDNHRPYFNRPGSLDKHRHVQAFTNRFPVEDIEAIPIGNTDVSELPGSYPATGFVVEGKDKKRAAYLTDKIMQLCDNARKEGSEKFMPFYLVFAKDRIFVFPKLKWKADSFPKDLEKYRQSLEKDKKEFVLIPASVETAGRGSTSDESTFNRMTLDAYCDIIKQTSVPREELGFIKEALLREDK